MIGTVVGNYKLIEKIGEGGMGAVYKGVDLMLEREVAIKVLKPELASQAQVVERFRSEAVTLAKLNHPNIATLYNFFRQGDNFFMVLEFVNGTPLEKIIETHGVMTCEEAIPMFCQILEGIDHAHSFGIIHRDIKPANMMLTQNGLLKVLDFGIARALGSARMTRAGHLIGTIEYMPPEQVRGMDTDARSDIYSLGMVLYEMLTGRVPFASNSEFELMKAQVEQLPTPPREFAPSIPEQVEWAILCATEKDPDKRFQTAGAFGGAIVDSVTTAMATGELSQIDMRRATSRLGSSSVVTNLLTSPNPTSTLPSISKAVSDRPFETLPISAETQRLPPATRLAGGPEFAADPNHVSAPIKATRLGEVAHFNYSDSVELSGIPGSSPKSSVLLKKLNRKHYVAGGILTGVLAFILLGVSLVTLRAGKTGGEKFDPSSTIPASTSPDVEPTQNSNPPDETTVPRNQPEASGTADRSSTAKDKDVTLDAEATPKTLATRKAAKPIKSNGPSRDRARLAREALDHK